jgi:hypothetical protein
MGDADGKSAFKCGLFAGDSRLRLRRISERLALMIVSRAEDREELEMRRRSGCSCGQTEGHYVMLQTLQTRFPFWDALYAYRAECFGRIPPAESTEPTPPNSLTHSP